MWWVLFFWTPEPPSTSARVFFFELIRGWGGPSVPPPPQSRGGWRADPLPEEGIPLFFWPENIFWTPKLPPKWVPLTGHFHPAQTFPCMNPTCDILLGCSVAEGHRGGQHGGHHHCLHRSFQHPHVSQGSRAWVGGLVLDNLEDAH